MKLDEEQERHSVLALSCCEAPYARGVGDGIAIFNRVVTHAEEASAKHQIKVRQSLAYTQNRQATSGIMRGLPLMCARRKERSDGIAIATKSIASSSPLREQMRGNT
jgi:hypothetical protein